MGPPLHSHPITSQHLSTTTTFPPIYSTPHHPHISINSSHSTHLSQILHFTPQKKNKEYQKSRTSVHYHGNYSTEIPVSAQVFQVHSRAKNASLHRVEMLRDSYKMETRRPKLRGLKGERHTVQKIDQSIIIW